MNEIERAIQEFEDNAYHTSMKPTISEASKAVALRILRAELSRQENAPLTGGLQTIYFTPYSCEYCGDHIAIGWSYCPECGTPTNQKRYEPKGEPACTQD